MLVSYKFLTIDGIFVLLAVLNVVIAFFLYSLRHEKITVKKNKD